MVQKKKLPKKILKNNFQFSKEISLKKIERKLRRKKYFP